MTQMSLAQKGKLTEEMRSIAEYEGVAPELIRKGVVEGAIVIPKNLGHKVPRPIGIGKGLRTKVNANIGTSTDYIKPGQELKKARVAWEAGADTIMDLSTGGDLDQIRRKILKKSPVPLGTVPIYQAAIETIAQKGAMIRMEADKIFEIIERHAHDGVDFVTVHCGVTRSAFERLRIQGRVMDIVSRGGAFLVTWMVANKRENPLYEDFDRLLEIAQRYDLTLSLGDGFRPGSIVDATDRAQLEELIILGELTKRAWEKGVQVMIEGPGHIPLDQVEANVLLEKKLCYGAPFYVLGPLVTDIAPGYDHIGCAIGGAIAAGAGADFLCYVTPGEHLKLPGVKEVREGVMATRLAAHAGDLVKGVKGAWDWDQKMSEARKKLDWEEQIRLSLDPELARRAREESQPKLSDVCTMCGEYCAVKLVEKVLRG